MLDLGGRRGCRGDMEGMRRGSNLGIRAVEFGKRELDSKQNSLPQASVYVQVSILN